MSKPKNTAKPLLGKVVKSDKIKVLKQGPRGSKYDALVEQARKEIKKADDSLFVPLPAGQKLKPFRNAVGMAFVKRCPGVYSVVRGIDTSGKEGVLITLQGKPAATKKSSKKQAKPQPKATKKPSKSKTKPKRTSKPKVSPSSKHAPKPADEPTPVAVESTPDTTETQSPGN